MPSCQAGCPRRKRGEQNGTCLLFIAGSQYGGMGLCNAWPAKSKIVHGIGSDNRARRMRLQPAKTRQRGSDLGDSLAATSAAVRGAGVGKQFCVDDFNPQALADMKWAFAKSGLLDAQLFATWARGAESCVGAFVPEGFADTAWSFLTAVLREAQLFTAFVKLQSGTWVAPTL